VRGIVKETVSETVAILFEGPEMLLVGARKRFMG
jgi:hypothetical protein